MRIIKKQFEQFHRDNPDVYTKMVELSRQAKAAGVNRYGIGSIYEVLRWDRRITTNGDDFKLNNDFRSRYARLIMQREPDLRGFFATRALRAE